MFVVQSSLLSTGKKILLDNVCNMPTYRYMYNTTTVQIALLHKTANFKLQYAFFSYYYHADATEKRGWIDKRLRILN